CLELPGQDVANFVVRLFDPGGQLLLKLAHLSFEVELRNDGRGGCRRAISGELQGFVSQRRQYWRSPFSPDCGHSSVAILSSSAWSSRASWEGTSTRSRRCALSSSISAARSSEGLLEA